MLKTLWRNKIADFLVYLSNYAFQIAFFAFAMAAE